MLNEHEHKWLSKLNWFSTAIAITVIIAYFLPFSILGKDSYITIHDNLDGEFIYKYLLVTTGQAFNFSHDAIVPNIMNGIPRSAFRSGLDFSLLLFYVFSPHTAYIVNHMLVHLIGFLGMFLLLKRHFLKEERHHYVVVAVSLCFFLTPFYSTYGISVAGQPLLLYAFLNFIERQQKWTDYLLIVTFPLYSHLILVAPFIIVFLTILLAIDFAKKRILNIPFLLAIGLLTLAYIAVEIQLLYSTFFDKTFISHRSVWNRWTDLDVGSNLKRSAEMLLTTQYHSGRFSTIYIMLAALVAAVVLAVKGGEKRRFLFIVAAIASICLFAGFHDWLVYFLADNIKVLKYYNVSRFTFLLPLLWTLLFALSLIAIQQVRVMWPLVFALCAVQALTVLGYDNEYKNNVKLLLGRKIDEPSYREFFSPKLFSEIDKFISKPKSTYRVVSVGMHPSVAQFNGFYTLDSYQNNYSLTYKKQFRQIIAKELDKNVGLRKYFDEWGNRCYVFVNELGQAQEKSTKKIFNLELDTEALGNLGGVYIFSTNEIVNYAENSLSFEMLFDGHESFRKVYLYKVL